MAIFGGMWRGRRCMPPASAARPTRGSGKPKRAGSAATMMSHARAISKPPPSARPFTAAITGLNRSKRAVMPPKPPLPIVTAPMPCCAEYFRSLPAEKALLAGAGDDRHPALRIVGEVVERRRQLLVGRRMQARS